MDSSGYQEVGRLGFVWIRTEWLMQQEIRTKPLFVFDGDCGLCRMRVARWRAALGDRVVFAPYQEVGERCPDIPIAEFAKQAYLFDVGGRVYRGAGAVFKILSFLPRRRWLLWSYERLPGVRFVCDAVYSSIAAHRGRLGRRVRD